MRQSVCGAFFLVAALLLAPIPAAAQSQFPEWDLYMNYWYQSSPATGAGDISMAVGADGNLYVFDADGTKIGEYPTGDTGGSSPVIGDDGSTYISALTTDDKGKITCFDHNLEPKWEYNAGYPIVTDLLVDGQNYTYFGAGQDGNKLYCIQPDGKELFHVNFGYTEKFTCSPTKPFCNGPTYIATWDANFSFATLYKVDGVVSKTALCHSNSPFIGSPSFDNSGTVYAKTESGNIFSIDPYGKTNWIYPSGYYLQAAGENGFRPRASNVAAPVSSPSIDVDGTIYFGREDGTFHAVNPDGTGKWVYTAGGPIKSSPAIGADGTIYFGCNDGYLYLLRRDGTLVVKVQYGGAIECSPTLTKSGQLYFGTADGYLHSVPVMAGLADSPWPMYRQNPRHTGSVPWIPKPIPFLPLLLLE